MAFIKDFRYILSFLCVYYNIIGLLINAPMRNFPQGSFRGLENRGTI